MLYQASKRKLLLGTAAMLVAGGSATAGITWLQKLVASDGQPNDEFGRAVALTGELLAISAPLDDDGALQSGSVHLFSHGASSWVPLTKLTVNDPQAHQLLGYAGLDLEGSRLIAGAPGDGSQALQAGAAYIFEDNGTAWSQRAKLTASDAAPFDAFGWAVAIDGSTAAVSAYLDDGMYTDSGAVYLFDKQGSSWVERQKLTATDAFASDLFGYRIDLEGDRLVVGAPWDDDRGSRSGSVYVYDRTNGNWTQSGKLAPAALRAGDQFGHDVSLYGARLAVGAAFSDTSVQEAGAAYVLVDNGSSWSVEARLRASDPAPFDGFGSRVSLGDRALLVTSEFDDHELGMDAGSATMFLLCGGVWRADSTLQAFDGNAEDLYATDAALYDGVALIGAARHDEPTDNEGSAYLYRASRPIGSSYCIATPNSSGQGAVMCAVGSERVADQDLTLVVEGLPPNVPGIMYFGPGQVQFSFGDGVRCVGGGPFYRMWPFTHATPGGRVTRPINWNAGYSTFINAGVSLNFQLWYRDLAAGGTGFNLTDAVEVPFE